jgi:hypothetical protein
MSSLVVNHSTSAQAIRQANNESGVPRRVCTGTVCAQRSYAVQVAASSAGGMRRTKCGFRKQNKTKQCDPKMTDRAPRLSRAYPKETEDRVEPCLPDRLMLDLLPTLFTSPDLRRGWLSSIGSGTSIETLAGGTSIETVAGSGSGSSGSGTTCSRQQTQRTAALMVDLINSTWPLCMATLY